MTANEAIGKDAMKVFQSILIGNTVSHADHLLVAPECLQAPVLKMIDDEIAIAKDGQPAYIGVKINSLTDKKIIDRYSPLDDNRLRNNSHWQIGAKVAYRPDRAPLKPGYIFPWQWGRQ